MTYSEILAAIGITQGSLETIIIFAVIAIGIGIIAILYWKFILAGVFALVFLYIFAHHDYPEAKSLEKIDAVVAPVEKKLSAYEKHMEECISLTSKEDMCEDLWKDKQ